MNRIQKEITALEAVGDRHPIDELLLCLLYDQRQKLEDAPTAQAAEKAWDQTQVELFQILESRRRTALDRAGMDEDTVETIRLIHKVLKELKILYRGNLQSFGVYAFAFAQTIADLVYPATILVDVGTRMCQIRAAYPTSADSPGTCQEQWLYNHSFSVKGGLSEADCKAEILTVIESIYKDSGGAVSTQSEDIQQTQRLPLESILKNL